MGSLDGRVIIITGAGRGIGRALAQALAGAGASVVVNDRGGDWRGEGQDVGPATGVVQEIEAAGGRAIADGGDVTDAAAVDALVQRALDTWGRLDGVVSSAGILRDRMVFSMGEDDWDAVMAVHLKGHFLLLRAACRHWRAEAKRTGAPVDASAVCVSSEAGIYGNAGQANYSAAKGGIISLSLAVAREMQRYGVRCNTIAPRARTRMTEGTFGGFQDDDGPHPWDPENVAPAVELLLGDAGRPYTGQLLVVGGGTAQVIAPHEVAAELRTGDGPAAVEDLEEFLRDALGTQAGPPPFPDLGLPAPAK
ncbi:MAG TPA: SDR family NAD(P)-dependent oxidoreductase [Baekduia sp.]|nr:SDR family NAD(P)-dependent oxidoreductase [Baekduia sp.]